MKKINRCLVAMLLSVSAGSVIAAQRPPEHVSVDAARSIVATMQRRYVGVLSSELDVGLVPRVSGVIQKQMFKDGDFVRKGQLLFVIEDTTYRAQAESAAAKLAQCEAEHRFASRNLKRISTLRHQNATSESSYDEAVKLESTAAAAVAAARAAKLDADNNLSYTRIYSPINGRAGKAVLSVHNYVTPASGVLLSVVSLDPIFVDFSISARDFYRMFGSFENMQKYAVIKVVTADGKLYPHPGKVTFLNNRIDKNTGTIKIRASLANPDNKLIPDSLITVYLERKSDGKAVGVPVSALQNNGKTDFVYVVGNDNRVQLRPVVAGEINGNLQVISSGLKPGETVIVEGTHKAIPNSVVIPVGSVKEAK